MKKRTKKYKPRGVDAGAGLWAIQLNKPLTHGQVDEIEAQALASLDKLRLGGAKLYDLQTLAIINAPNV